MLGYLTEQLPQVKLKVTGFDYQGSLDEKDVAGYDLIPSYGDFIREFEDKANDQDLLFVTGSPQLYLRSPSRVCWETMGLVDLLGLSCYTEVGGTSETDPAKHWHKRKEIAMKTKTFTLSIASLAILSL